MKRTLLQMYVKNSAEAVGLYQEAFEACVGVDYRHPNGACAHTELDVDGQILALCEAESEITVGNSMQFCLHFRDNERNRVEKAYEVLKTGAQIIVPIGECPYSNCMFALIDRFGIYWCIFN